VQEISAAEFSAQVAKGEKLVILEDLVLDVSRFMEEHPGGRFSLEHNIGRDVTKFFIGAYSLENTSKV
jgi:cytochrome b involved in lipid metabolism